MNPVNHLFYLLSLSQSDHISTSGGPENNPALDKTHDQIESDPNDGKNHKHGEDSLHVHVEVHLQNQNSETMSPPDELTHDGPDEAVDNGHAQACKDKG
jgi:hypothetical protein